MTNKRVTKKDLGDRLATAELHINEYQPPAAGPDPPANPPTASTRPIDLASIQRELANYSAIQRTDALFDFLVSLIQQGAQDEIAREQLVQKLGQVQAVITALTTRIIDLETILARHGLT